MSDHARSGASFRDPAGFVFRVGDDWRRQLNAPARDDWDAFQRSGLAAELLANSALWPFEELTAADGATAEAWHVLRMPTLPFVSYPYEWSYEQLRAAALHTLALQRAALARGMTLKDASAYNIQFVGARPVFIDTLSFARDTPGAPWAAYRQFCQHFLGPLALMAYRDPRLGLLARTHLDGAPLDLVSTLLPRRTWWKPGLLAHLHVHARSIQAHAGRTTTDPRTQRPLSADARTAFIDHLASTVRALPRRTTPTEWSDYATTHNYSSEGQAVKAAVVREVATAARPQLAFDLGANTGDYSRIVHETGATVIALDGDVGAVDALFQRLQQESITGIIPLWMDLSNPSPSQGWAHGERMSLTERGPADLVMALALVHHLAIGNNVPLPAILEWLVTLGSRVIVEWVPKHDPQAQRLLVSRADIFADYTREAFDAACTRVARIERRVRVPGSDRELFVLTR